MIDSASIGGNGVLDAGDGQYIFRQRVEGPTAGNDNVNAFADGVFQCLAVGIR